MLYGFRFDAHVSTRGFEKTEQQHNGELIWCTIEFDDS